VYAARGNKWRPRYKVPQGGGPSLKGRDPRAKKKGRGLTNGREGRGYKGRGPSKGLEALGPNEEGRAEGRRP
jgi:hypothetical protein